MNEIKGMEDIQDNRFMTEYHRWCDLQPMGQKRLTYQEWVNLYKNINQ